MLAAARDARWLTKCLTYSLFPSFFPSYPSSLFQLPGSAWNPIHCQHIECHNAINKPAVKVISTEKIHHLLFSNKPLNHFVFTPLYSELMHREWTDRLSITCSWREAQGGGGLNWEQWPQTGLEGRVAVNYSVLSEGPWYFEIQLWVKYRLGENRM